MKGMSKDLFIIAAGFIAAMHIGKLPPAIPVLQQQLGIEHLTEQDVPSLLEQNDALCKDKHQPDLPVLELRIDGQIYVFNSLYRVWMIESIFSNVLEEKYKTASTSN